MFHLFHKCQSIPWSEHSHCSPDITNVSVSPFIHDAIMWFQYYRYTFTPPHSDTLPTQYSTIFEKKKPEDVTGS